MRIVSIEPTPSPLSMKINVDQPLPDGVRYSIHAANKEEAPTYIKRIMEIEGIKSIFQVKDFIAVDRHPKVSWERILPQVRVVFGEKTATKTSEEELEEGFGEVQVAVQMFRGLPVQVKVTAGDAVRRVALPQRFADAVLRAQAAAENMVLERKWIEQDVRYGELDEVADTVAQEFAAAYDEGRLNTLVSRALRQDKVAAGPEPLEKLSYDEVEAALSDEDWKKRYAALVRIDINEETLPLLGRALQDPNMSIRRLATAFLGEAENREAVLPYLYEALRDASATVRRTAGDTLSDIGDPEAMEPMCEALFDRNRIVRWRAARFLYEVGDESVLPALKKAIDDPEFEVKMQVQLAIERIEGGHEASGSVWQQMTRRLEEDRDK
ncbi:conserved virulence factor C family protein [Mechercharimyces sp. CAU 1602]|uniref:conserved virulence factor C family protein n=1 Tax=Mechercharimyces sp. CAU 1602 TaxID=2973933 RepID=UPI002163606B|nr:virulence factor [Mechercharimyces sp. CAU 1602]MCS1350819.1 virulence factor [Mechercharimyces sp. CAU 1602]